MIDGGSVRITHQHSNHEGLISALPTGRRSLLGFVIGLIWALITGSIGTIAARFIEVSDRADQVPSNWIELGSVKGIPDGKATKREIVFKQDSGWARFSSSRSIWIVRRAQRVTVFSATCPHLGCTVDASGDGFACPCHGSSWNANGDRLGGPTARSLDVLQSRVDGDTLRIRYENFKQGSPDKEPV